MADNEDWLDGKPLYQILRVIDVIPAVSWGEYSDYGAGGAVLTEENPLPTAAPTPPKAPPPRKTKTAKQKWDEMSPPERAVAYATASGQVLGKAVAAGMFLATGAEVFHVVPDFIDATRAMDIFAALSTYYGVPFLWTHRPGRAK